MMKLSCLALVLTACMAEPDEPLPLDPVRHATDMPTATACGGEGHRCLAHARTDESGHVLSFGVPTGLGPRELAAAYALPDKPLGTPTIAITDAYDYPQLEADLAIYRAAMGLPACAVASGCLRIVNGAGDASPRPPLAPSNDDWTKETALDVDAASAACPQCKLLVVLADNEDALEAAVDTAARLGATVISNSWGVTESNIDVAGNEVHFDHPGIAIFASSGDRGYDYGGAGPLYPATSAHVISVGATALVADASARGYTETAWADSGSACSVTVARPSYQTASPCAYKSTADVAAVGDPQTALAVYDSKFGGWIALGGTSASAPIVAAIFASIGHGDVTGDFIAQHAATFHDVTAGQNGTCGNALCDVGAGWDGPTGFGTPDAFALVAATTMPAPPPPTPVPVPSMPPGDVTGGFQAGCSAGGGANLGTLAFALLALRRRHRRCAARNASSSRATLG